MTVSQTTQRTQRIRTSPITWDKSQSRSAPGKPAKLVGYANITNEVSHDLGGFVERMAPGAFKRVLSDPATDVYMVANHEGLPIARESAGTLKVTEDGTGLRVEAEMAPTSQARDIFALVQSGHLAEMSYAFRIGKEKWSKRDDGTPLVTVTEVADLIEVSVVPRPAYPATTISARARGVYVKGDNSAYGTGSEASFFRDLVRVSYSDKRAEAAFTRTDPGEGGFLPQLPSDGSLEDARRRLSTAKRSHPNSAPGEGGEFEPRNTPANVAAKFAISATARGVLPGILGSEPIPKEAGGRITIPALSPSAGSTVSSGADGAEVAHQDPTTTSHSSLPVYVSGYVDISQQLLDLSSPQIDLVIGEDLGAKCGSEVDRQILNGNGTNQLTGLLNVAGISTTTFTQATPTGPLLYPKIGGAYSSVTTALGYPPDAILYAPRRWAWLNVAEDSTGQPLTFKPLAAQYVVPAMPTTVNSTQDVILVIDSGSVDVYMNPPVLRVLTDFSGSSNLIVRIAYYQAVNLVVRQPQGIGVVSGSGLTTPAF